VKPLDHYRESVWESDLPATEKMVLLAMTRWMDVDHLGDCRPGHGRVQRRTSLHKRTVERAVAALVAKGWLEEVHHGGGSLRGTARASVYRGSTPKDGGTVTPSSRSRRRKDGGTESPLMAAQSRQNGGRESPHPSRDPGAPSGVRPRGRPPGAPNDASSSDGKPHSGDCACGRPLLTVTDHANRQCVFCTQADWEARQGTAT
jgi:hypothetical protein